MGTRSTISFYDDKEHYVSIYQQYDGYLSGVGQNLYDFLNSKTLVNGLSTRDNTVANGAGCLFAQFIKEFKTEPGGLYLEPSGNGERLFGERNEYDQHYAYHVNVNTEYQGFADTKFDIEICVFGYANHKDDEDKELEGKIFQGSLDEYKEFLKEWC